MNPLGLIADPDLRATLQLFKEEIFFGLNCHQVGQIVSFDLATGQATVQIMMQRVVFNQVQASSGQLQLTPKFVNYPVLVNVPVFCVTGSGFVLTLPVAAGDECVLLFNDRDLDNWFSTGAIGPPNTSRAHDLSDGMALVGFRNLQNSIPNYSGTAAELRTKDNTGKVSIAQALTLLINGTEIKIAVGTTVVDIDSTSGKVGISNASTSLKSVLDNFISVLKAWEDTHGDTPNAATLTALTNAQTLSDSLLK